MLKVKHGCPACGTMCFSDRGLARHWGSKTRMLKFEDERAWDFGQHWPAWGAAEGLARFLRRTA